MKKEQVAQYNICSVGLEKMQRGIGVSGFQNTLALQALISLG